MIEIPELTDEDLMENMSGGKDKKKVEEKEKNDEKNIGEKEKGDKEKGELPYNVYLNKYFELKNQYETKLEKTQKRGESENEKKCIHCGKSGGTLFSNKNNRYTAVCGAENPCKLRIELYRGFFMNSLNILYDYNRILEESKQNIIRLQNDEIFHFEIKDNLKLKYEKEKVQYETVTELFTDLKKCLYDNREIKDKIQEKVERINEVVIEIRSSIGDYKKSLDTVHMQNAISQQTNVLLPLLEELRNLKYEVTEESVRGVALTNRYLKGGEEVVERRLTEISTLVQRELSLDKEEINLKEPPSVIHWIR